MSEAKHRPRGKTKAIWRTADGIEQRRCAKCGEWLPADKAHFYYKRDTLMSQCRTCSRETSRNYQRERYVPRVKDAAVSANATQPGDACALAEVWK